jgi:hypothetical protein
MTTTSASRSLPVIEGRPGLRQEERNPKHIPHEITQGVQAVVHAGPGKLVAGGQPVR